jgi:hypothetical protein
VPGEAQEYSILQKRDTAVAAIVQSQSKLRRMKTRCLKTDWIVPALAIALVAGTLMAARTYLNFERKTDTENALTATLDRLYQDQQLTLALKTLHDGDAAAAARRLDLMLCEHIVRLDAELPSADNRTRTFVEDAFHRMARVRPKATEAKSGDSAEDYSEDVVAAERILGRAQQTGPQRAGEPGRRG